MHTHDQKHMVLPIPMPCPKWNLSYECLTSFEAREALQGMKPKHPTFWQELAMEDSPDLPSEKADLPEDSLLMTEEEDEDLDDSDVPIQMLIMMVVGDEMPAGVATHSSSSLMLIRAADSMGGTPVDLEAEGETLAKTKGVKEEKGQGKHKKMVNRLYQRDFW
ncbi:hypothetical protein L208DRAFT_1554532 [Tricholoma matsutake]|nr:hypothetical protein L208DRAFT_1554532 [Tricholoma matsutake 945]